MDKDTLKFADESELAGAIRKALGVGDYETVEVILPQFERTDDKVIRYFPKTTTEFDHLKKAPHKILIDIGLGLWEEGHYLFPAEWYDFIPEGYPVYTINRETEKFQCGVSDDDRRFGCLPYGFKKQEGEG